MLQAKDIKKFLLQIPDDAQVVAPDLPLKNIKQRLK